MPSRLGVESVGKVNKIGKNVQGFNVGDIVLPLDRENWVQQKMVLASNLILLPKNIDPLQSSMMKVNPATAYLMIKKYVKLNKNDWIIQDAANSGVGHSIISIAKELGLNTVNIVRREGLEESLKNIGADVVVIDNNDLSKTVKNLTNNANIKLAIDAVGGDQQRLHQARRLPPRLPSKTSMAPVWGQWRAHPCLLPAKTANVWDHEPPNAKLPTWQCLQ